MASGFSEHALTGSIRDMESYQASLAALHNPAAASTSVSPGVVNVETNGQSGTYRLPSVSVLALVAVSVLYSYAL